MAVQSKATADSVVRNKGLAACLHANMARIIVGISRKKPENKAAKNTKTVRP
jgi:hypothetical protein